MSASRQDAIVVEGLARAYGGLRAVDGVDLTVAEGEIYGFLGPNGAGKSTTVRILTTLLRPTAGRALVAGHDVEREAAAVRRVIGVALQEAALDPLMTGRELLQLQGALHGLRRGAARERGEALLDRVALQDAADRRLGTYSGGMRRRLDLAMALVHEPRVLFLDEPTTGLDPSSRATLWDEVRRLNDDGTTVFLTTQYLEEAEQLADRVGIIDQGRIVAEGTPDELKARVGDPVLHVDLIDPADAERAAGALAAHGAIRRRGDCGVLVQSALGARAIAPIVRTLDEAGVEVDAVELETPTLDDVFLAVTGHAATAEDAPA
ncbi:MAG: ATP-binding cassette domain-containing protein [Solirubrobacteraceae bacterium]|jgi:ABC-2 type transport system ATP-binding protein|nr:ATP-binding cassette domain-containing protein [Solirubrobacteraceae bacterium]